MCIGDDEREPLVLSNSTINESIDFTGPSLQSASDESDQEKKLFVNKAK